MLHSIGHCGLRLSRPAVVLAGLLVLLPAEASARVSLAPGEAAAGSALRLALTVAQGCDGEATVGVRVELPDGFVAAQPMAKPGWTIELETGPYDRSHQVDGVAVTEGIRAISWTGGALPAGQFDEFVFRGVVAGLPADTLLAFPTVQSCANGEVAWTEVPAAGEDADGLAHPAPTVRVAAPAADDHGEASPGSAPGSAEMEEGQMGAAQLGTAQVGPITVTGAFARASVSRTGAAYLTLDNAGEVNDRLRAVTSPAAIRVELHSTSDVDGLMRMERLRDGVAVPAQGRVVLRPGEMHVMLMGLSDPLVEGETLSLTLRFEHAGRVTLSVPILGPGADGADPHGNH